VVNALEQRETKAGQSAESLTMPALVIFDETGGLPFFAEATRKRKWPQMVDHPVTAGT